MGITRLQNNTFTMSSSNDAVFLRRNNQIQDAIDSQNMKQAFAEWSDHCAEHSMG
jgi:hypothetical protein